MTSNQRVYAWLGYWRDKMPPEAVTALQDLLGPLRYSDETAGEPVAWCVEASHDGSLSPPTALRMDAASHQTNMRAIHPGITWTLVPLYRRVAETPAEHQHEWVPSSTLGQETCVSCHSYRPAVKSVVPHVMPTIAKEPQ